ncbi:hypothetical protein EMCRGX_G002371 [Ephydatia muelleri]
MCVYPLCTEASGVQPSGQWSAAAGPSNALHSGAYHGTGYAPSGSGYPPSTQTQRPSRRTCKNSGCTKPVYDDPTYGAFDYCSPLCRDAHLLGSEREKLLRDIDEYTKQSRSSSLPSGCSGGGGSGGGGGGGGGGYGHSASSSTPPVSGPSSSQQARSDSVKNLTKVTINKRPREDLGIIVSKNISFSPAADRPAFLITGVATGSPAYTLVKEGKLKLFGLIARVGDKFTKHFDESFSDYTRRLGSVDLYVEMSKTMSVPSGTVYGCTHVIGIRYESTTEDVGIDIRDSSHGVVVEKVKIGKVPELSGVCARDIILPSQGKGADASSVMAALMQCQETGNAMILCIKRN